EPQLDVLEAHDGLVLTDERVLRLAEDLDQRALVELTEGRHHRQAADELRDQAELDEVLGMHLREQFAGALVFLRGDLRAEAHRRLRQAALAPILQPDERAAADEEDVGGVDLDEFLVRMLPSALRRNVGHGSFEDLEQRLLHALAGDVARDRRVVALAADLVDLVDVDDAALRLLFVVARGLVDLEDDVLDVLTDVTRLGQRRGVDDRERHGEHARQRLRQKRLASAGRADQEDVRLLQLDFLARVALVVVDPLVVVVDGDRELFLRPLLADDVEIEELLDLFRLRKLPRAFQRARLVLAVFGDDVETDVDALVADVDRGTGDQLLHVALRLVAEATTQNVAAVALLRHSDWSLFLESL